MKMLLMIPIDVIESVASIREYLEGETKGQKDVKWKDSLELLSTRNKAALDASADAIIITDEIGTIEFFNPGTFSEISLILMFIVAAESMLGYFTHEVLGKNVRMFTPDAIAAVHDSFISRYVATRKSKTLGSAREVSVRMIT